MFSIFYFIAIFEIIVSLLLMCSLLLYVKRIIMFNQRYGRYAFLLGVVFIVSNAVASGLNFYKGTNTGWRKVDKYKSEHQLAWCLIFVPYYSLTEFAPAITFALVMQKYGEINEAAENVVVLPVVPP